MFKMCRKIDLSKPGPAAPALAVKQTWIFFFAITSLGGDINSRFAIYIQFWKTLYNVDRILIYKVNTLQYYPRMYKIGRD